MTIYKEGAGARKEERSSPSYLKTTATVRKASTTIAFRDNHRIKQNITASWMNSQTENQQRLFDGPIVFRLPQSSETIEFQARRSEKTFIQRNGTGVTISVRTWDAVRKHVRGKDDTRKKAIPVAIGRVRKNKQPSKGSQEKRKRARAHLQRRWEDDPFQRPSHRAPRPAQHATPREEWEEYEEHHGRHLSDCRYEYCPTHRGSESCEFGRYKSIPKKVPTDIPVESDRDVFGRTRAEFELGCECRGDRTMYGGQRGHCDYCQRQKAREDAELEEWLAQHEDVAMVREDYPEPATQQVELTDEEWDARLNSAQDECQWVEPPGPSRPTPFEVRTSNPEATFESWHMPGRRWGNVPEW